jgi:hypothetical protein
MPEKGYRRAVGCTATSLSGALRSCGDCYLSGFGTLQIGDMVLNFVLLSFTKSSTLTFKRLAYGGVGAC